MAMEKNFDAASAEADIYAKWESSGAFKAGKHVDNDETRSFTIMIPPPNVTGALHVGHSFNNTLQDILVRWHRMRGFDTLWQPGQDHAGIATQLQVEKQLMTESNLRRTDMSREDFLAKVWEWKGQYGGTIVEQLKRLGSSCDWSRNAFTMAGAPGDPRTGHENSPNFHDAVIKVFVDMYEKGLIYRGKRLVNWDPHFETAISDLEVENIEVDGHMWHFKYPLAGGATYTYVEKDEDGNITLEEERDYISIATTRPETMLGDGAVAVHPSDERYASIVGKLCEIPVGPKEHRRLIPIITDMYPDKDFGSGAVKITGAHDFNDYQVAKRGGIPMYRLMDTKGHMRDDGENYATCATRAQEIANGAEFTGAEVDTLNLIPDDLRGLDRFAARDMVVVQITGEGLAVMVEEISKDEEGNEVTRMVPYVENKLIMQPFGDRSKVVIEPMLTDQWFVETSKIVGPALDAVKNGDIKIIPESGEKTYYHWLENIEPWCISRQLWWGHQIPVWYDNLGNAFCGANAWEAAKAAITFHRDRLPDAELMFTVLADPIQFDDLDRTKLNDIGFYQFDEKTIIDFDPHGAGDADGPDASGRVVARPFGDREVSESFYGCQLERDPDVLDTWFSSGLWPIGTLGWPEDTDEMKRFFPTDVLITGQDILFFWVARMIMMQLAVVDEIPFHTVYLHGLVRDEKGKKMSKTTGNVIDPLVIVDEYGADALRFANAAMASIGGVLKLSTDRIKGYRNFGTKIWNAARFAEMNECKPSADFDPTAVTQTVNKWIVGETARALESADASLEAYRFNDNATGLYAHVWGVVCDWYVEFAKPLLQSDDAAVVAETRATMAWAIDQCLILLHPIMPYITEQLWGDIADRPNMLVHEQWPNYTSANFTNAEADREMGWVIDLIESIRSIRAEMRVPAGAKIPMVQLQLDDAGKAAYERNAMLIHRLARIDELTEASEAPKGAVTITVEGGTFCLPLADIIDVDAERSRLTKAIEKLGKEMGGIKGKLNNEKFTAKAPAAVVEENRARLAAILEEVGKLEAAMQRLAEMG